MQCIALCNVALHVHCIELQATCACTELHCTELHCTELHCTELHCTELHCTELHCTELHCTELHCTELHCTELHHVLSYTRVRSVILWSMHVRTARYLLHNWCTKYFSELCITKCSCLAVCKLNVNRSVVCVNILVALLDYTVYTLCSYGYCVCVMIIYVSWLGTTTQKHVLTTSISVVNIFIIFNPLCWLTMAHAGIMLLVPCLLGLFTFQHKQLLNPFCLCKEKHTNCLLNS